MGEERHEAFDTLTVFIPQDPSEAELQAIRDEVWGLLMEGTTRQLSPPIGSKEVGGQIVRIRMKFKAEWEPRGTWKYEGGG